MKWKKLLIILIYCLLFAVCFGVISILNFMTNPKKEEIRPSDTASVAEATESDAVKPSEAQTEGEETLDNTEDEETKARRTQDDFYRDPVIPEEIPPYVWPTVFLATDLHYQSPAMTDYGQAFDQFVAEDDGKLVPYITEILEAFLDEVIEARPSALVLSGDISLNGERENHIELARRLARVKEAGIPVLIIPGNHDINNTNAATYFGNERKPADPVTPEDFYEIYHTYGYDQAVSRDDNSLSYLYQLDEKNWLMMLDSCQYTPVNRVEGQIRPETYEWMEEQFVRAEEAGAAVIPIAHHNLLGQSRLYVTECIMEENDKLLEVLDRFKVPVFFSGHLHLQRIKKFMSEPGAPVDEKGIHEVVTGSMAMMPCRYGIMTWNEDGTLNYLTRSVDVQAWAVKNQEDDENLLNFNDYGTSFMEQVLSNQMNLKSGSLPRDRREDMSRLYADLLIDYAAGDVIQMEEVTQAEDYKRLKEKLPDNSIFKTLESIMKDSGKDQNSLTVTLEDEMEEAD